MTQVINFLHQQPLCYSVHHICEMHLIVLISYISLLEWIVGGADDFTDEDSKELLQDETCVDFC